MAGENVRLASGNFCLGPAAGLFYSLDTSDPSPANYRMVIKNSSGTTVDSLIPDTTIRTPPIYALDFDGRYFYSLEHFPSSLGVMIRKWLPTDDYVLQTYSYNLVNKAGNNYYSKAFCFEKYNTTFGSSHSAGSVTVQVSSTVGFVIGQKIYFGPSTVGLYNGLSEERTIRAVLSSTLVVVSAGLTNGYSVGDAVRTAPYFWLFTNDAPGNPGGGGGGLYKFRSTDYNVMATYNGGRYNAVNACAWYNGDIVYIKGNQLLVIDLAQPDLDNARTMNLLNFENNYVTNIPVYDMLYDSSSVAFRLLQLKRTTEDAGTGALSTDSWATYNYITVPIAAYTRGMTVEASKYIIEADGSDTVTITAKVIDQWGVAIPFKTVNFLDNGTGQFASGSQDVTDSNGEASVVFTAGTANEVVTITAKITGEKAASVILYQLGTQLARSQIWQYLVSRSNASSRVVQLLRLSTSKLVEQKGPVDFPYGIAHLDWLDRTKSYFYSHKIEPAYDGDVTKTVYQLEAYPGRKHVRQHTNEFGTGRINQKSNLLDKYRIYQRINLDTTDTINQYIFVVEAIPVPYSIKNPITISFYNRLGNFSQPLNASTLVFKVNGVDIANLMTKTPIVGGLEITYDYPDDFSYGERVYIYISIEDTDTTPNIITQSYYFDIVEDLRKPFLVNISPSSGSTGGSVTPTIQFDILDYGDGVDISSLELFVEGIKRTPTSITSITDGYRISYTPTVPLPYDTEISIAVTAIDLSVYENYMFRSWVFRTAESTPPLYMDYAPDQCEVLVDPRTSVVVDVYGQDDGIDEDSITLNIDSKTRVPVLRPKIYRRS